MFELREDTSLWDVSFPAIGNRTPRSVVGGPLADDPRLRDHLSGAYGARLIGHLLPWLTYGKDTGNPELTAYWARQGIRKELHVCREDPDQTWVSYVPDYAAQMGCPCPVWFINHAKGRDLLDVEGWGFVQMVAEKQIIVLTVEDGNSAENIRETLRKAAAEYPVDLSRVYLVGHSFSGSCSGRIVIGEPERYAGLCMLGSQYSGLDSTPEEKERAQVYRMPRIDVHGTAEKILPFNRDSGIPASPKVVENVTPTDMGKEACWKEQTFWRTINHCRTFSMEATEDIQHISADIAEQKIGTLLDHTGLRVLGGVPHYIGDVKDENGRAMIRHVAVEGAPHYPSAYCAELAWEFLHSFSRDMKTGELKFD